LHTHSRINTLLYIYLGEDLIVLGIDSVVLGIDLVVLGIDSVVLGIYWVVLGIDCVVLGIDLVALRALALRVRIAVIKKPSCYSVPYDPGKTTFRRH
jgi:hypothetical protein